uniref:Uncharacterized protein n=1 Tax=Cynoglossus semilaevis TaxID=244447 RepID=A0A3P8W165_CYNSE
MDNRKRRRELSQDIRKKIIDKHLKGKGYKTISKQLEVPVTTVPHIIQKFKTHGTVANLPGRGRKRKIDDKLKRRIVRIVSKEPRTTSKEIKGELQGQGTSVSDRTIRRCLSQSGLHGRRPRRTPLLKKNHKKARLEFAKMHVDKPQSFWEDVLWTDETKLELFVMTDEQKARLSTKSVIRKVVDPETGWTILVRGQVLYSMHLLFPQQATRRDGNAFQKMLGSTGRKCRNLHLQSESLH